jgi:penicillin-binding protein 1C
VSRARRWGRRLVRLAFAFVLALALASVTRMVLAHVVSVDLERFARPDEARVVRDRHGELLRIVRRDGVDHAWVPLAAIAPAFVDAVLAAEDARFRVHDGIDSRALVLAVFASVLPGRRTSGGSTITQQLVKLVYGRPHRFFSKPREMALALALERRMSKDEILEQYLNRLPFGHGIVGVERASQAYFAKSARELTLGEASLLAGIPQAP